MTRDNGNFNRWIVFVDCNGVSNREEPLTNMICNGFYLNGKLFVLSERSASMTRNSILSFIDAEISDKIDERIGMEIDLSKGTVLSKYYAYRGLMLSSCHCLDGWTPKVIVVPDYEPTIKSQRIKYLYDNNTSFLNKDGEEIQWKQKDIADDVRDIPINAFDGCGIHHPAITDYVATRLDIRTRPTSMLLRAPYIKGVSNEMDYVSFYEERGVTQIKDIWGHWHPVTRDAEPMLILTESMFKGYKYFKNTGTYEDWENYWCMFRRYEHCFGIAKWNFSVQEEPVYTRSNYQVLQDLELPYEKFKTIAEYSLKWAERIMSGDPLYTMCFLGITNGTHQHLNSYCKAVLKNPEMLKEECVRKFVRSSLSKYRDDFKCGKLYVKSAFKFLVPDLVMLMEHIAGLQPVGCLEDGEFFSNDAGGVIHGERVLERNPHICHSEHAVLSASESRDALKWFSHLEGVVVLNCKSIITARLQGCDFDGDLGMLLDSDVIKSGIDRDSSIVMDVDDKITVLPELDTRENRLKVTLRTMKNMIGEYSNYASAYHNKSPKTDEQKAKYKKNINVISVLTGKSID